MRQRKVKENLLLSPLRARRVTAIAIVIVGRALTLEKEIKERSKEILAKIMQRRLRAITFQKAIE